MARKKKRKTKEGEKRMIRRVELREEGKKRKKNDQRHIKNKSRISMVYLYICTYTYIHVS